MFSSDILDAFINTEELVGKELLLTSCSNHVPYTVMVRYPVQSNSKNIKNLKSLIIKMKDMSQ